MPFELRKTLVVGFPKAPALPAFRALAYAVFIAPVNFGVAVESADLFTEVTLVFTTETSAALFDWVFSSLVNEAFLVVAVFALEVLYWTVFLLVFQAIQPLSKVFR